MSQDTVEGVDEYGSDEAILITEIAGNEDKYNYIWDGPSEVMDWIYGADVVPSQEVMIYMASNAIDKQEKSKYAFESPENNWVITTSEDVNGYIRYNLPTRFTPENKMSVLTDFCVDIYGGFSAIRDFLDMKELELVEELEYWV